MKNILEEIAARTRERIAKEKSCISVSELENRIQEVNKNAGQKITFLQALQKDGMSYICEVKKASPSKGLIAPDEFIPVLESAGLVHKLDLYVWDLAARQLAIWHSSP